MSLIQSFLGFRCAITGSHSVSEDDEIKLFKSSNKQLDTHCIRCGAALHLEICEDREEAYKITEI